ncbi:hypothetical protein ACVWZ4_001315 [Bradyrhizobium sp. USDA 4472]
MTAGSLRKYALADSAVLMTVAHAVWLASAWARS